MVEHYPPVACNISQTRASKIPELRRKRADISSMEKPEDQRRNIAGLANEAPTSHTGNKRHRDASPHDHNTGEPTHPAKRHHIGETSDAKSDLPSPTTTSHSVPLPHPTDTTPALEAKLTAILAAVTSGQSMAAATNYLATPNPNRDPVAKAVREMNAYEREFWDAYTTHKLAALPTIDWTTDISAEPTSTAPLKVAKRRAEALNRLYKTDQARPGHSVWFTKHHLSWLPLVKAVARVIGAERNLRGGVKGVAMADLQTVNAILGVVGKEASQGKRRMDGGLIARVQAILGSERTRLRALVSR
ncbi:MAG: hypothetical protein L6R40_008703 [Gallowayella cf. fulva]|nr:MAG: hypothetical protein L6R40_008703 [Xanthomendoza cf. fulva]